MAEVRRPSCNNHVQQTPRIGGCTGAFFNLFDWNNTKRFASTKRLPPERPEKPLGRSKSFRDDRSSRGCSPSVKTNTDEPGVIAGNDLSSRPPVGLVARLMGLESLPEATPHRRSQSFSGSESVYYFSEKDSRPERLPLRDMLKQEHGECFETSWKDKSLVVPTVEYKNRRRVKKGDADTTPIKSSNLVPYVDSPCRSVFALEYKGEKSPFLARLHPSPVLQPSKRHNQMAPTTTSAALKKCEARFLEAAVKVLEGIPDNEECLSSEREGMRSIAECAAASSPAGTDLLHSLSMSKTWNRSDGYESVGSRSNRSLMSRSSLSVRDPRIRRDIFEGSLSDRAQSKSPGSEGRRILRTQEAAVGDFKIDVRKASSGARKDNGEGNAKSSFQHLQHLQQTATPESREKIETLHFQATRNSNGLEDHYDVLTFDEESPFASTVVMRKFDTFGEDHRSSLRKSPRKGATSSPTGEVRVVTNSRERLVQLEVSSSQLHTRSTHDGLRPIQLSRNRKQENSLPVSTNRALQLAKSRSAANSPSHSRRQKDDLKLAVSVKNEAPSKKEKQGRAMATESPALQCHSPLSTGAVLKRTRRKARHGSPKLGGSAGPLRSVVRSPSRANLHGERSLDQDTLEVKKSPGHLTGENKLENSLSNVLLDIALPDSRSIVDPNSNCTDENLCETGEALNHEKVEQIIQNPVRDSLSSPKIAQSNSEVLILGMEDLHWDDSTMEQQRGENSSRARYCEIRASGESLQSFCGALDEDVCNVDFENSPSPQKCAGECSEADIHDESLAPVLVKRLLGKPSRLDVDMGVTSPISVLKSPFGDEVCTTSESSITESEHRAASDLEQNNNTTNFTGTAVAECEINQEEASTPTPLDKIRQAILDISSFKNRDQTLESNQASPQTEKTFVREVLSAAQLLCSPGRSPNWYERDLAVDPALFEKLEGGEGDFPCESGGMWRCDRKLLFDCVNEAFSQTTRHFMDPQPWLRRPPVLRHRSVRQKLVEEVQEKIHDWRELASHAIDTLIDIDMSSKEGKWTDFSEVVSNVGAEIEAMVWQVMVEETVLDLAGSLR